MYEVEEIVNYRVRKGKKQYEVKWKGYDSSENTWEPLKNLSMAKEFIKSFEEAKMQSYDGHRNQKAKNIHKKLFEIAQKEMEECEESMTEIKELNQQRWTKKEKKKLKIVGMSETLDHQLIYKVMVDGKLKWVKRSFFIPDYLLELVEFYEANMTFKQ